MLSPSALTARRACGENGTNEISRLSASMRLDWEQQVRVQASEQGRAALRLAKRSPATGKRSSQLSRKHLLSAAGQGVQHLPDNQEFQQISQGSGHSKEAAVGKHPRLQV